MPADHAELRKPFPKELISQLPPSRGRPALDYVNHAVVTDRLLQHGGAWEFRVFERFEFNGRCYVHASLRIDDVTREDYGEDVDPKTAISDALKRCAMRFGVGLDLWTRDDLSVASVTAETTRTPEAYGEGADGAAEGGSGTERETPGPSKAISNATYAKLVETFGSSNKALIRARHQWDVKTVMELTENQAAILIGGRT